MQWKRFPTHQWRVVGKPMASLPVEEIKTFCQEHHARQWKHFCEQERRGVGKCLYSLKHFYDGKWVETKY